MKKHLSTILLSLGLVICLAILGTVVYFLIPKECTHYACNKAVHAPTCEDKGYTLYECKSCDYSFEADFVAPLGHKLTEETVASTCEEQGYTLHTCSVCEKSYKDNFISPKGHNEAVSVIDPECNVQGYTLHECLDCDYYYITDYVKPTGHDKEAKVVEATCDEEGYTLYSCRKCSYSYKGNYKKATGHTYTKTYVRPNIAQTGYTVYTCTKCKSEHIGDYVFYSDIFSGAEGTGEMEWGLDLSRYSKNVDFNALKNAGVDFVILRVGSNANFDPTFEQFYRDAKAAGLDVGAYFFTYATNKEEAAADAARVAKWLDGKTFEYPIFYDIEDVASDNHYPSQFSSELLTEIVHTFMTEMVEHGYYPGIYTGNKIIYDVLNSEKTLRLYDVWFAHWASDPDALIDEYSSTYSMWQYMGDVEGFGDGAVEGFCDINYAFKNYPAIMKKHGFNGY